MTSTTTTTTTTTTMMTTMMMMMMKDDNNDNNDDDDGSSSDNNNAAYLTTIKMALAIGIFIMVLLSVLAPQRLVAGEGAQYWFSLGNMAASGVLLSGGMVHMLADAASVLDANSDFPMANFVAGLTFIGFMVIEELLHVFFMSRDSGEGEEDNGNLLNEVLLITSSHDHGNANHIIAAGRDSHHSTASGQGNHQQQQSTTPVTVTVTAPPSEEDEEEDHDHSHSHGHQNDTSTSHSHSHSHSHDHHHHHDAEGGADERTPLLLNGTHHHTNHNNPTTSSIADSSGPLSADVESAYEPPPPIPLSGKCLRKRSSGGNRRRHSSSCRGCVGQPNTYAQSQPRQSSLDVDSPSTDATTAIMSGQRQQRPSYSMGVSQRPESHHHHEDHLELHLHGSTVATFVLMVALSIHAILAGVSIGIEDATSEIASTAFAILAHKSFEGFCLGSSLVSAQLVGTTFWSLALGWTIATPLGIFIGWAILDWANNNSTANNDSSTATDGDGDDSDGISSSDHAIAIVEAMVAGTFLYISIVEIGSKELLACRHDDQQHGSKWQKYVDVAKLICFVVGYLAMSSLALFV